MGTTAPNDKGKQVDGQQGARDDTGTFFFFPLSFVTTLILIVYLQAMERQ